MGELDEVLVILYCCTLVFNIFSAIKFPLNSDQTSSKKKVMRPGPYLRVSRAASNTRRDIQKTPKIILMNAS